MNVLHLPENIASQIAITVKALREIGVPARGLIHREGIYHPAGAGLEGIGGVHSDRRRFSPGWFRDRIGGVAKVVSSMHWADVVHYHFGGCFALSQRRDFAWLGRLDRLRLVTFWGSDIRVPEIEERDNPYFARSWRQVERWTPVTRETSRRLQECYARRGFHCVIGSESMIPHIVPDLFPRPHLVRCGIDVDAFAPSYPDPGAAPTVLVHMPSDLLIKGTPAVLAAVDTLRARRLDFEFRLVHRVERARALEILRSADLFLDQFVLGGYGMASIEAMALGKPVVCYVKPTVPYPDDLPIVNANLDDLAEVLEPLILDGDRRHRVGMLGRAYVESYHESTAMARQLERLYAGLLAGAPAGRS